MFNKLKAINYKKILCLFIIFIFSFNFWGCKNRGQNEKNEKELNIFIDIKDKHSLNTIKFLVEEFEKENPKINVKINNSNGIKNVEDVSKEKIGDIIITSRNNMIELQKRGYLNDLSNFYEKNKINQKYYNAFKSYGRYCDKYYGMSIIPYTMEIFYNKDELSKLKLPTPTKVSDLYELLKNLNQSSIRVPVILTEDLDIYSAISSLVVRDKENMYKIDCIYDFSEDFYKERKEFQSLLDDVQNLYKKGVINKNTFELGNEGTIKKFVSGDIPLIISTSYYYNELNKYNIGLVEDYDSMVSFKGSVPVIVNALLCSPINGGNSEEVGEFVKFVYSDETQKKLLGKGYITGNIEANKNLTGIGTTIRRHLEENNENGVLFSYNLPENLYIALTGKIEEILSGKYNGKEWETILKEVYKQK